MIKTKRWEPVVYLAPTIIVLLIVFLYPTLRVLQMSTLRMTGPTDVYVGMRNFEMLLPNPIFQQAVTNGVRMLAIIPVLVPLAVIVAALLYERMRGWQIYRTLIFFPYVVAIAVSGIVWCYFLRLKGPFNLILQALGLDSLALDWLGVPGLSLVAVMAVVVWRELGFGVVLFLARLMSMSEEIIESARLDGAAWYQVLWYVLIPQLFPVIEFWIVILVITALAWVFDYVFVMTLGGPGYSSMVIDFFIYVRAFRDHLMGMAAAASVLLLIASLLLMYLRHRLTQAVEELV